MEKRKFEELIKCDKPLWIPLNPPIPDGKGGLLYKFPAGCGKCLPCLMKRKAQWSFRMVEEKRNSFSSCFVTLTYNDLNVPYGKNGFCINKNDHFEFIKSLKILETDEELRKRKILSSEELARKRSKTGEFYKGYNPKETRFKYYGVCEYGDENDRPHWHYILFNVRDINNINCAWNRGIVQVDECNVNTIDYVLKYMIKEHGDGKIGKQREVSFMSKGIGNSVADAEFKLYIKTDRGNQVLNQRGGKVALPRYYSKKYIDDATRRRKGAYIAKEAKETKEKQIVDWQRQGLSPLKQVSQGIEIREHLLKSRQKRVKV